MIVTRERVGKEKSISTVAFPSQKIVWIAEIGWKARVKVSLLNSSSV